MLLSTKSIFKKQHRTKISGPVCPNGSNTLGGWGGATGRNPSVGTSTSMAVWATGRLPVGYRSPEACGKLSAFKFVLDCKNNTEFVQIQ